MSELFDILVVGGGINGVGVARDAAGRGLSVLLCEKDDLAQGTSSRSGRYIHGGLRYLEYYEFRLVREALIEREVMLSIAPHLTKPLRLVLVHSAEQRPRWLLRLGLLLYDNLGGRKRIPGTRSIDLRKSPEGAMVRDEYTRAFSYYDVWVDDARLVALNAVDAARRGAAVQTRTECVSARREDGVWRVELLETLTGVKRAIRARAIVNTAGPWVENVIGPVAGLNSRRTVRLVKGSHIIMKRWWDGDHGYVLQNSDKRIIFVNPYFDDLALIGTTDIPFDGRPEDAAIDNGEIDYLLGILNRYFKQSFAPADVVNSYSGVRPLFDDDSDKSASAVTRDYEFELSGGEGGAAPILSAFGGKLTTYRKLAEHALDRLRPFFPEMKDGWTGAEPLPGGAVPDAEFEPWCQSFMKAYPWLPAPLARHYARCFGADARVMLGGADQIAALGRHFGGLFYEIEARWLMQEEWARTAEDILTRRTKHHMFLSPAEIEAFESWMALEAAA